MHTATFKTHTSTGIFSSVAALNWVADSVCIAQQRRTLAKLTLSALERYRSLRGASGKRSS